MPAAIPIIAYAAATAAGATTVVATLASMAASFLVGNYQAKKEAKKQRDAYNAAQVDRLANVSTTVAPRDLVLGRVRKGGAIYFRASAGAYKELFVAHLAIAGHEIDAIEQIYLNDVPVSLDSEGWVTTAPYMETRKESRHEVIPEGQTSVTLSAAPVDGTISAAILGPFDEQGTQLQASPVAFTVSGNVVTIAQPVGAGQRGTIAYQTYINNSFVRIRWELGSPNAGADSRTRDLFPDLWTENHRAQGVAKVIGEFTYSDNAFPNGVPNLTAVIRGAKVYDPRNGTTAWSENPALLARHIYTHPFFGKSSCSSAEDARFIAAANACDTSHEFALTNGQHDTAPLYRASMVAQFGTAAKPLLDDLCASMAGRWAVAGGELYIQAGVYTAPVMTLTDADLAVVQRTGEQEEQDAITISVHRERAEKFNVMNPRIWDMGQDYKEVAITPVRAPALIARDGGVELAQDLPLTAVFWAPQAQHVAGVLMRDARDPLTIEAPFKLTAYPLEIFDTVALTLPEYGWTAKTFVVLDRVWDRQRGVIRLTMKETSAAIYTPDAAFLPQGYAQNTGLPTPWDISPPSLTAAGVSSGTSELVKQADGSFLTRVHVTWPALSDASVVTTGQIEVQWSKLGSDSWVSTLLPGGAIEVYLTGPVDGDRILLRARARSRLATSDWSAQVVHQVVGKSEPPTAPSGVALTRDLVIFVPSPDVDVKGYRILYNPGSNANRSVASPLHAGLVTASPWPLPVTLYGTNTIIVVAVDTSGNESKAATDTRDLGQPDAANVADTKDLVALGFPGIVSNGAVSGGVLVSASDPAISIYGTGAGGDIYYRDGAADVYGGDQFLSMEYRFNYFAPYDGGAILMDMDVVGPRVVVECRVDGGAPADFYDDGRPDLYADDEENIYGLQQGWAAWSGAIAPTKANLGYEFRITVDAGAVQGQISTLTMRTEMPQIEQVFGNVAISSGGTHLDPASGLPARSFISIENVLITPIGTTAVGGRVKTYPIDPVLGPEVELLNASAAAVSSNAYVRVSGY